LSEAALRQALERKASEYRLLRRQISEIDEKSAEIGRLKASARIATDALDFAEVESILSELDRLESEGAVQAKELRAQNALLRGQVDQAYKFYSAAADSYSTTDPTEVARKRIITYHNSLRRYGLSNPNSGLSAALQILEDAKSLQELQDNPWLSAACENSFGVTLLEQGRRAQGDEAYSLLRQALKSFERALLVRTQNKYPDDWAMTIQNEGVALLSLGEKIDGIEAIHQYDLAIKKLSQSLEVRGRDTFPQKWALTKHNIGCCYKAISERTNDKLSSLILAKENFVAALQVRSREDHSYDWAVSQSELGSTKALLASISCDLEAEKLFEEAEMHLNNALLIRKKDDFLIQWAITTMEQAKLFLAMALHNTCDDRSGRLSDALELVENAEAVFKTDFTPEEYSKALKLKSEITYIVANESGK